MADIATLGLRVDATQMDDATKKVQNLGTAAQDTERKTESLGKTMAMAGRAIAAAWITREVLRNTIEAQYAIAQLEARIRSTGGAAGKSSEELQKMAAALQSVSIYSDEAIMSAQAMLLTFKNIRGGEFDRALQVTLDLAAAMGTDATGAALQLGKALEDPTIGLTALRRSGVSFSEAQQEQIKIMVEAGQIMEAQNMILAEMETQFGGAAAAARDTLGGALAGLKNDFGDLLEMTRENTAEIVAFINAIAGLVRKFNELRGVLGNLLPPTPNPGLNWILQRVGGGGEGGGTSQAVRDTTYLIPLMDTLTVTIRKQADAAKDLATQTERALTATERLAIMLAAMPGANANLWANRGYQSGSSMYLSGLPTPYAPPLSGGGGGGAADGRKYTRGDYASALLGGMGGTFGNVSTAVIQGGVQAGAAALLGAIGGFLQDWAAQGQRAREIARQLRVALSEFRRSIEESIAGMNDNPVEQMRVEIQRMLGQWVNLFRPGTDPGTFGAGARSIEDLVRALNDMTSTLPVGSKELEAWLKVVEYAGALFQRQKEREAEAAYRAQQARDAEEERVRTQVAEDAARAAEELAQHLRDVAEAARLAAIATRQLFDSLEQRGLMAAGRTVAAGRASLLARHRQDLTDYAGQSPDMQALVRLVQTMELAAYDLEANIGGVRDNLELQLAALQDQENVLTEAFEAQDQAYAEQIKTASEALRVAQDQLRTQERTVDELRRVVENLADFQQSLLTSNLTTLSPRQQLDASRAEFQRLAASALAGDMVSAGGLPAAARTFLEASRGYNASGVGYGRDFDLVQMLVAQVQGRVGAQLSTEERILDELQAQTGQLEQQIRELEAARNQAYAEYQEQLGVIREQMAAARAAADAQIAALQAEFDAARDLWQAQLDALLEQIRLLQLIGTQRTDEGGQLPPPIVFDLGEIASNTAATVTVLQAGMSAMATELASMSSELSSLRSTVKNGLEMAV